MSGLELNKIVGAILVPLLAVMVISKVGDSLVHPRSHGAAHVETGGPAAKSKAAPKEEKTDPVSPLLAKASAEHGKSLAKKCAACHSFDKGGKPKIGPNLWGVVNADKGSSNYNYSSAMKEKPGNWTYEELNQFLHKPSAFVPKTKMVFPGFKKVEDRADMIAYLRSLADTPAPLP